MIYEYAVDPEALASFNAIWQALENFGVSQGRVLVQCPKKWWKIVREKLELAEQQLPPAEYKKLEERCFRLKDSGKLIVRKNLKFDGNKPFLDALMAEHTERPFRAVLQLEPNVGSLIPVLSQFDFCDDHPLWKVRRSQIVTRTANEMATAVKSLLCISSDFLFVDPYFSCKPQDYQTFVRMLQLSVTADHAFQRIEIHTSTRGTDSFVLEKAQANLTPRLPKGVQIKVFRWKEREGGERLHDRFVLTNRGGMEFPGGLDTGQPGQTTNVHLLDQETYEDRWRQYQSQTAAFDLDGDPLILESYS